MQSSMNLYLSLLCNELYPADNDIDECFAIGFTGNLNMPDNWLINTNTLLHRPFLISDSKMIISCLWFMLPIYVTKNYFQNAGVYVLQNLRML